VVFLCTTISFCFPFFSERTRKNLIKKNFNPFFRPRFRPQNSHSVPLGLEVQDHRTDPDRHRPDCVEDVEGTDPGSAVTGSVRRNGHLQVHQAQSCRRGNIALPVTSARTPPRRVRSRQSVQRTTARTVMHQWQL
jgi:hypothetical protein